MAIKSRNSVKKFSALYIIASKQKGEERRKKIMITETDNHSLF